MSQMNSAAFLANPSCIAFAVLQRVTQMMTKAECVDKMWNQYSSTLVKSGCILSDLVTLDQLRSHDFEDTQGKTDFLA